MQEAQRSLEQFRRRYPDYRLPPELVDDIWLTPGICPKRRSSGAVTELAITAGLAPGYNVKIWMVGKSTCGSAETGEGVQLRAARWALLAGTLIGPRIATILLGHHVLKMHPGILLGVCAGAGTSAPALAAIQEVARSKIPTLGYGVSYAVGNVLLALWGTVVVVLMTG